MLPYHPIALPHRQDLADTAMEARSRTFLEEIQRRHTVRDFSDRPVPRKIIEDCLRAAGTAPSGANLQPWHFVAVGPGPLRGRIRAAAEAEERAFYDGKAGAEWLEALAPLGTDSAKPFLDIAPWLIVIFGQRRAVDGEGRSRKTYYVPESVGIATGLLIAALHRSGLATLTHTPSPMGFLNGILNRPVTEKAMIMMVIGHPAEGATIPLEATRKKPLAEIATFV